MQRLLLVFAAVATLGLGAYFFWDSAQGGADPLDLERSERRGDLDDEEVSDDLGVQSGGGSRSSSPEDGEGSDLRRAAATADGATLVLTGRVVAKGGKPVAGARVSLRYRKPRVLDGSLPLQKGSMQKPKAREKAETSADGSFRIEVPAPVSRSRLRIRAARFVTLDRKLESPELLAKGGELTLGKLELQAAAIFRGRVVDAYGKGVPNAAIFVRSAEKGHAFAGILGSYAELEGGSSIKTDAQGRFEATVEKAGEYRVRARHDRYVAEDIKAEAKRLGDVVTGLLIRFAVAGEIKGRVTGLPKSPGRFEMRATKIAADESSSILTALEGSFDLVAKKGAVAEDGSFQLQGLELGARYRVRAVRRGESNFDHVVVAGPVELAVPASNVELPYRGGVVVVFDAVDAKTGEKLDDVRGSSNVDAGSVGADVAALLRSARGAKRLRRSPDGRFRLEPVRPEKAGQTLKVSIDSEGYRSFEKTGIPLPESGQIDLGTIRFEEAPTLLVEVVDAAGEPVRGARVRFERAPKKARADGRRVEVRQSFTLSATSSSGPQSFSFGERDKVPSDKTDEDGVAELELNTRLDGVVSVQHKNFAKHKSEVLVVAAKGTTKHRVLLSAGGRVEVTVLGVDGKPKSSAQVLCQAVGGQAHGSSFARPESSDEQGIARFRGLTPGEYDVSLKEKSSGFGNFTMRVESSGDRPEKKHVFKGERALVVDGQTTRVTLRAKPRATLRGVVTLDGMPLQGARVRLDKGGNDIEMLLEGLGGQVLGGGASSRASKGRTDREGTYELEDVKVGRHRLRVTHPKLAMPQVSEVRVVAGTTRHDIAIRMTRIEGVVVDEKGQPVVGAAVRVERAKMGEIGRAMRGARMIVAGVDSSGGGSRVATATTGDATGKTAVTDASGRFVLAGAAPGQSLVVTAAPKKDFAEARSTEFKLRDGEQRKGLRLVAKRGGSIEILVPEGKRGLGLISISRKDSPAGMRTLPLKDGKAKAEGLGAGTWTVSILGVGDGANAAGNRRDVVVKAGETARCEF